MTIKEQIKILDNKIRQNQAEYDLYRKNAEISALSSGELKKYEYLTGEEFGYRPDPVQKAKFEYSPIGQVFNKGLDKNERQEGLLKRFKNIEDKTDIQLRVIERQKSDQLYLAKSQKTKQSDPASRIKFADKKLNELAEDIIKNTKKYEDEDLEYSIPKGDKYDVNTYKNLESFAKKNDEG